VGDTVRPQPTVLIANTPRRRQPVIVESIDYSLQVRGTEAYASPLGERPRIPLPSITAGTASSSAGSAKRRRSLFLLQGLRNHGAGPQTDMNKRIAEGRRLVAEARVAELRRDGHQRKMPPNY
jgi:hypothetical protein